MSLGQWSAYLEEVSHKTALLDLAIGDVILISVAVIVLPVGAMPRYSHFYLWRDIQKSFST